MWGIIGTWRMAFEGIELAKKQLINNETAGKAIVVAIKAVEDYPFYKSVGYGGLPNEEMIVELDAAFMDGDNFSIGAVAALKDFANPILIAKKLAYEPVNNFLVGSGAEKYAQKHGFIRKNMLTERAQIHYHNYILEAKNKELTPYTGHDTVGMVCLDFFGSMTAATSTSGLFMKKAGRVGDSPISGSGFYVDSEVGGAVTTGLGEDLMKGCVSYEVVRLMKEGVCPQLACEQVVKNFSEMLVKRRGKTGDMSLIAMDKFSNWGAATNIDDFSFVVATAETAPTIYCTKQIDDKLTHQVATKDWLNNYMSTRTAPLKKL